MCTRQNTIRMFCWTPFLLVARLDFTGHMRLATEANSTTRHQKDVMTAFYRLGMCTQNAVLAKEYVARDNVVSLLVAATLHAGC